MLILFGAMVVAITCGQMGILMLCSPAITGGAATLVALLLLVVSGGCTLIALRRTW